MLETKKVDAGAAVRSMTFLYESGCICVLRWCVCAESGPAKSSARELDLHKCMWSERQKPAHPILIYGRIFFLCHVHLIPRFQGRLKQDATLQTVTVWQLITTAKATASLSWHLKSVWITHIMSDRQIVCAPQIFSVLLLFQRPTVESSCIFTASSVLVCKQFLFVFHVDINLLSNSLNDDFFLRNLFKADLRH